MSDIVRSTPKPIQHSRTEPRHDEHFTVKTEPDSDAPLAHNNQSSTTECPGRLDDDVQRWALQHELSMETMNKLQIAGFTSLSIIRLILDEDIVEMDIKPLAQRLLLKAALKTVSAGQTPAVANPHSKQQLENGRKMQQLQSSWFTDPSYPLVHMSSKKGEKYLDIVDFVHPGQEKTETIVLGTTNDGRQLVLEHKKKMKLENVSPSQWMGANARITNELLKRGSLDMSTITTYLAYTIKISLLAEVYTWESVLLYDREYRKLQATHNFAWGRDMHHLSIMTLRKKPSTSSQNHPYPRESIGISSAWIAATSMIQEN